MGKQPKVAVLLATFNGEAFLLEQLNSIAFQNNVKITVYYSDDCSTDMTLSILKSYTGIKCVDLNAKREKFGTACKNFFHIIKEFDAENFDYICLSDQDDVWQASKIDVAISHLKRNYDCYSGSFKYFSSVTESSRYVNKKRRQTSYDFYFRSPGPGFTFVFQKSFFTSLQENLNTAPQIKLNSVSWHDWYIYMFARINLMNWYIDEDAYAYYRLHGANETGLAIGKNQILKRLKFILSGAWRKDILLMCELVREGRGNLNNFECMLLRFSVLDRFRMLFYVNRMRERFLDRIILVIWLMLSRI